MSPFSYKIFTSAKLTLVSKQQEQAIIIGAGPAGLTAAYELLTRSDIKPIVLEMSEYMGGISRTVRYKGNRIDIGGHRFFTKSDRVFAWWLQFLKLQKVEAEAINLRYRGQNTELSVSPEFSANPETENDVMLVRSRLSRIYYNKKLFAYPIELSFDTVRKLGILKMMRIGTTYLAIKVRKVRNADNLEDFFISRFGTELYNTFFKSYTEKVWGRPPREISAEWGAQRVKGLSITKAIQHALQQKLRTSKQLRDKAVETSLIEQFFYPKYGPGQMWEVVAEEVLKLGGEIITQLKVVGFKVDGYKIQTVYAENVETGEKLEFAGDFVFSTMPIRSLVAGLHTEVPKDIKEISDGLQYRDFITVGLLVNKLKDNHQDLPDNWIYIHEPGVHVGRIQFFNNWSPYMVEDQSKTWIGLEYFCNEGDDFWNKTEEELKVIGAQEFVKLGFANAEDIIDATVIKMEKTYPAYFGTYERFSELRAYLDKFANLFLVGRNGMHRYNNQDHSMLTAMTAVDNILEGRTDKSNLWEVNTEEDYHEEK